MKKKMFSLLIILLFIMQTLVVSAYNINPKVQEKSSLSTQTSDVLESNSLESTTIKMLSKLLKDYVEQMPVSQRLKDRYIKYIEEGLIDLEIQGITSEKNLIETSSILKDNDNPFKGFKRHKFLFSINPDNVEINVTLPTLSRKLKDGNTTIEIFIKLIPFVDSVMTSKRIIIRRYIQETSILFPAIGLRFIEDNNTTFILAFGRGMKRSWRLF